MYMYYINYTMYSVFPYNNMFTKYYYSFLSLSLSLSHSLQKWGMKERERLERGREDIYYLPLSHSRETSN